MPIFEKEKKLVFGSYRYGDTSNEAVKFTFKEGLKSV